MTTEQILTGIKAWVLSKLSLKQDAISDLAAIRSGAQAGTTAVQPSDLSEYFNDASYDTSTHRINFYHGQDIVAYVDASPFIVDGMVDDVRIENGYLVIDFNTASGKQDINIPLTDIFNPSNYYNKTQTDTLLGNKVDKVTGKGLSTNDYTNAEKEKLSGLQNYDDTQVRQLIGNKVDKVAGKGLSTNDYTDAEKAKLTELENYDDTQVRQLIGQKQDIIQDLDTIRSGAGAGATAVQPDTLNTALSNTVAESGVFDLSVHNAVNGVPATYTSLSAALTALNALSAAYKTGGMSFKFIQSSDNKYVRCNLLTDSFTTDVTKWAVDDAGVYVENPEYIYVKTDKEGRILWAIKHDGIIYYGAGVPQQVIDYINEKIDGYDDVVAFLNDYLGSDTTLKVLIDSKLDAEGLNPNGLSSIQTTDAPDFFDVTTDENGKVLEGITTEGTKQINIPLKLKDVSFENGNGGVLNLNSINLSESGVDSLKDDLGLNTETHAVNTVSYLKYNNINEQRGLFAIQMDTNPDNNISGYLNMLQVLREYGLMSMDFAINITALQSPYINNFLELQHEGCEIIYHNRINSPSDFSENSSLTVEEAKAGVCAERLAFTQKGFTTFGVVANNGSVGERYKPMIDSLFCWSEYGSKQPHQAYQNTKAQYLIDHRIIRTGFDMTDVEYETPGFEEQEINYAKTWIDNLCTNKTFGVMYCHWFEGTADVYRLHETTLRAIAAYIVEKINNGELYYGSTTECLNLLCK